MTAPRGGREFQKTDPHLRTHPYFLRFVRLTGMNPNLAHGILAGVWALAYDHAKDGDLSRFEADELADLLSWESDPQATWDALIASGFLVGDGIIHDWPEWGGSRFSEREYEAARKASYRYNKRRSEQAEMSLGQGCPGDVPGTVTEEKRREEIKDSSPKKRVSAVSEAEWQQRSEAVLSATRFPALYRDFADLLASKNATGKVALSRVVRDFWEPLLKVETNGVGREGFEYGMRAALGKGAPNVNYVKRAAENAPAGYVPKISDEPPGPAPEGKRWAHLSGTKEDPDAPGRWELVDD